jgi:steroid delta-isomerase-like uncharacterized protein
MRIGNMGSHMSMSSYRKARIAETERIVRVFHECWDLRDPERGVTVIAEDCQFEDVARGELQPGREGYRRDYQRWREAFPDGEVKVVNVIVQDDWAVVEFVNRGTQTGPLHSSLGTFPATGRRMEVRYCSVMRVADGMVVEGRDYYDSASIARQLGLVAG